MTEDEMLAAMRAAGCCVKHDMPVGRDGKCDECRYQDAAEAEYQRDGKWLWDHR